MKKNMIIVTALMLVFTAAFSQSNGGFEKTIALNSFKNINVASNIVIVLTENNNENFARITGSEEFVNRVVLQQKKGELNVSTTGFKNLKPQGTVYIPVSAL